MNRTMMKRLRLFLSMMLGIMLFKLFIMGNRVQYVEEAPVVIEQAVSVTLKLVEEDSPLQVVNVGPAPPESVEIIPSDGDSMTAEVNAVTRGCCEKISSIPGECYEYCTFAKLDSQTIVDLAVRSTSCNMDNSGVWNLMMCMSSSHDHTKCCKSKGVHKTEAGDICLDFCTGRLRSEPMVDMTYYTCLSVWEPITDCFKNYIIEEKLVKTGMEIPDLIEDNNGS